MLDFNDRILEILKWVKYILLFLVCKPQCLGEKDEMRNCSLKTRLIFYERHRGAAESLNCLQVWAATQISGDSFILLLFRRILLVLSWRWHPTSQLNQTGVEEHRRWLNQFVSKYEELLKTVCGALLLAVFSVILKSLCHLNSEHQFPIFDIDISGRLSAWDKRMSVYPILRYPSIRELIMLLLLPSYKRHEAAQDKRSKIRLGLQLRCFELLPAFKDLTILNFLKQNCSAQLILWLKRGLYENIWV